MRPVLLRQGEPGTPQYLDKNRQKENGPVYLDQYLKIKLNNSSF